MMATSLSMTESSMSKSTIASVGLSRLALPLTVPYMLSFGPVTTFDTVIVEVRDGDGEYGFGEATILTGYTPETIDACWVAAGRIAQGMIGVSADAAKAHAMAFHAKAPFTVTALVTAVEMLNGHSVLTRHGGEAVPLLAILNATSYDEIETEIAAHAAAGYDTIKVKVGWNIADDLARVAFVQSCLPPGVRIRIDGNQGYCQEDGVRFAAGISPNAVELLEQPCHMDDWTAARAVAEATCVPYMLDESIYGDAEIEHAAEIPGVTHVKLKLMKAGSLDVLIRQLGRIRDLGMTPVLGNGVAADPGCWMEACVARACIDNAGEMNGFLKPCQSIFADPFDVHDGAMTLPATIPGLGDLRPFVLDRIEISAD